jgi:hypothetical protein
VVLKNGRDEPEMRFESMVEQKSQRAEPEMRFESMVEQKSQRAEISVEK